jgi:hypothetical protein
MAPTVGTAIAAELIEDIDPGEKRLIAITPGRMRVACDRPLGSPRAGRAELGGRLSQAAGQGRPHQDGREANRDAPDQVGCHEQTLSTLP